MANAKPRTNWFRWPHSITHKTKLKGSVTALKHHRRGPALGGPASHAFTFHVTRARPTRSRALQIDCQPHWGGRGPALGGLNLRIPHD
eukprot:975193-Prymnesium_polylepis.1